MLLRDQIVTWLRDSKRIVMLGIGNPMRGDDAIGMEVVRLLKGEVSKRVRLLECQTVPENFAGEIKQFNPTHVLMIDAAHFEAEPGEARLIQPEEISGVAVSTHAIPLYILAEILRKSIDAKVLLLGLQPKTTEFGEQITPELQKAAENIAKVLLDALRKSTN